ncbi:MAG: aminopeptidase [Erysipelotrichaceae bacterium]|nr:aminopeptidase [Erysipelotrichaceae bacterium]
MKKTILKQYAQLLVEMGVNIQKGQELMVFASIKQEALVKEIAVAAYKKGAAKVSVEWGSDALTKVHYRYQSVKQLGKVEEWEKAKLQHRVDVVPARIYIADEDPDGMKGVNQKKVAKARMMSYPIIKPYIDQLENKEQWCIAGAASPEWAKKVFPGMSKSKAVEKLWEAILETSRMGEDPVRNWKEHNADLRRRCDYLNSLNLKSLHYEASNGTDFTVGLIDEARFLGGSELTLGSNIEFNPNIPSEEVFTSPMKGEAEGIVYASMPLSYEGELIENFSVRFESGKAVEVKAEKGEELLKQMISMDETAAYLGEAALIPYDSPIRKTGILFYNTLYDENASCHLALGMGFTNVIKDYEKYTQKELQDMGVNDSMIHVDFMIGTRDMNITGTDKDGKKIKIFENGNWAF